MTTALSEAATGHDLARFDWLVFGRQTALHAPAGLTDDEAHALVIEGGIVDCKMLCGRVAEWAMVPGVFTRMGLLRCGQCNDRAGYPRGIGSPKNDATIRAKEGWE